jgi:hypothetical protein
MSDSVDTCHGGAPPEVSFWLPDVVRVSRWRIGYLISTAISSVSALVMPSIVSRIARFKEGHAKFYLASAVSSPLIALARPVRFGTPSYGRGINEEAYRTRGVVFRCCAPSGDCLPSTTVGCYVGVETPKQR